MSQWPALRVVVARSGRLREERVTELLATWNGEIKTAREPSDVAALLLELDTPSLFAEASTLHVVRGDEAWFKRHAARFEALLDGTASAGSVLLVLPAIDGRSALGKRMKQAGVLEAVSEPGERDVVPWLVERLNALAVTGAHQVASALVEHCGADVDRLLGALDLVGVYCGDAAIDVAAVQAVVVGERSQPVWEFTGAFLEGRAGRAIDLIYAGDGMAPEQALHALVNELRKLIACTSTRDDDEARRLAGIRHRSNLHYARRRATDIGRKRLVRLLNGVHRALRECRRTGSDPEAIVETLVLHAQRLLRGVAR